MRILLAFLLAAAALLIGVQADAADPVRKGRIAAPQQPYVPPAYSAPTVAEPAYKTHNWYLGGVGGYAWTPDEVDDTWHGGIVAGYLWRPNPYLGAGVEADYVVRDLSDFAIDDGIASVRGRLGVFVARGAFLYGTAGVAQATEAAAPDGFRKGLVVGGGIEKDVVTNIAVRAEVLHYTHGDSHFEWGDESSTAGRVGLLFKF